LEETIEIDVFAIMNPYFSRFFNSF